MDSKSIMNTRTTRDRGRLDTPVTAVSIEVAVIRLSAPYPAVLNASVKPAEAVIAFFGAAAACFAASI